MVVKNYTARLLTIPITLLKTEFNSEVLFLSYGAHDNDKTNI